TEVTLNAIPNPGYEFAFWSGSISGADPRIALTMNSSKQANAHFKENKEGSEQENEVPLELVVSLGVGSEPRHDNIFRQDETMTITAHTNGETDNITCTLDDPLRGEVPIEMTWASSSYEGELDLGDLLTGSYLLRVEASKVIIIIAEIASTVSFRFMPFHPRPAFSP
ncbi:unnamed protein product, partial [marine sediment metagenome]